MNKMIVIGAGALVLLGAAGGGAFLMLRGDAPEAAGAAGEPAAALPAETFYHSVQPEFVVNLPQPSRERFLMTELVVATVEEDHLELLERHRPELRNELLSVFAGRDAESLATEDGKRELRDAARARIDALLERHGAAEPVQDVFLTRFVMQ